MERDKKTTNRSNEKKDPKKQNTPDQKNPGDKKLDKNKSKN